MKKISCIIPAYNEEKEIGNILSVLVPLIGKTLCEVIVINDCSQDATKEIVKTFPAVILIDHAVNQGKTKAVVNGVKASTGDYIFMLDADLRFINEQNIIDIIEPIERNIADITMVYIKNAWPLFPFKKIDYLSGERILKKTAIVPFLPEMERLPSYGLEVFLNRIIIRNQMRLSIVQWPNVENVFHQHKDGWIKGVIIIIGIWLDVLSASSIIEVYSQNFKLRKLLVTSK